MMFASGTGSGESFVDQELESWQLDDYNATVARESRLGWEGLGYVLILNGGMFLTAFVIFQLCARSTRFSLYCFTSASSSSLGSFWPFNGAGRDDEASSSNLVTDSDVSRVSSAPTIDVDAVGDTNWSFPLTKWYELLWQTPIEGTSVEVQLGPEATFYLLFQVYTCKLLACMSVFALLVLFPLYLTLGAFTADTSISSSGSSSSVVSSPTSALVAPPTLEIGSSLDPDEVVVHWWSFSQSTIRSIPNGSEYLWIPVASVYVFSMAFGIFFHRLSRLCQMPSAAGATRFLERAATTNPKHSGQKQASSKAKDPGQDPAQDPEQEQLQRAAASRALATAHLIGMAPSEISARSIFVHRGVPLDLREERMMLLLQQVFPRYIEDVCVVLNLSDFYKLRSKRLDQESMFAREKMLCERQLNDQPIPWCLRLLPGSMMVPSLSHLVRRLCRCLWCLCGCGCKRPPEQPKFFQLEEQWEQHLESLRKEEEEMLSRIVKTNRSAGRAFIIFRSARHRARFVKRVSHQSIASILSRFPDRMLPKLTKAVRELGLTRWHLTASPEPDDLDWQSVSVPFVKRTAVVLLVNVLIVLLLLLFTSPVAVTSAISGNTAKSVSNGMSSLSGFVSQISPWMAKKMVTYFPTLILVTINAVLLNVLQFAGRIQPIATDSGKERMILRTSSIYLVFSTLFVPSLAFVSIDAVLLYLQRDGQVLDMLGTLFLHNSGTFYVNYVLQRAFLGTAVNLLRVPEFGQFTWAKFRAVTPAEHVSAVQAWPFFTGTQSAIQVSMLVIVMTFSTVVPVIVPVGMLYMAMQHAVDKYSLMYVRPRIKGRGSIARTCTHSTIFAVLIYQAAMAGFFLVRGSNYQIFSVMVLLMVTYIVSLYWYLHDKQRAHRLSSRGLSVGRCRHHHHHHRQRRDGHRHHPQDQPAAESDRDPHESSSSTTVATTGTSTSTPSKASGQFKSSSVDETTPMLALCVYDPAKEQETSDLYREPALRGRKSNRRKTSSSSSSTPQVANAKNSHGHRQHPPHSQFPQFPASSYTSYGSMDSSKVGWASSPPMQTL